MNITRLKTIKPFFFSSRDVAQVLGISAASGRLAAHRYYQKGLLVRLKRDVYVLPERWEYVTQAQIYAAANRLQVPSYVSLTTALSFYEITTQIQQDFFESIAVTRTKKLEVGGIQFRYTKVQRKLYFGFVKKDDFFIATPEKAFLDALYLVSLHRYRLDSSGLDLTKFNWKELRKLSRLFPIAARRLLEAYAKSKTA